MGKLDIAKKKEVEDMTEIWMDLKGYHNKYQVSNKGRIWSVYKNRILKPKIDKDGYEEYCLTLPKGKRKTERGHRLVALMFCDKPEGYNVVNHKNMIKNDNRAINLEWSTVSLNTKHAYDNSEDIRNSTLRASKMGAEARKMIIKVSKDGELVGYFNGQQNCADQLGLNRKTIYNGMNSGISNRKGYSFETLEVMPCL